MKFATELPVRFGDIDLARVVYYPRLFHYLHQAFEEWFASLGTPYPDLVLRENLGFPSVRVETEFLRPLRYGDTARVEIEIVEIGSKSLTLRYGLSRVPGGEACARAVVKTVAINHETFAPVPIPDAWRRRFEQFRDAPDARG